MDGTIKTIVAGKPFGFIAVEGQEKDVFFHQEACEAGAFETLKAGDKVTFDVEQAEKGPRAVNVKRAA